jgi:hypothetical protein
VELAIAILLLTAAGIVFLCYEATHAPTLDVEMPAATEPVVIDQSPSIVPALDGTGSIGSDY